MDSAAESLGWVKADNLFCIASLANVFFFPFWLYFWIESKKNVQLFATTWVSVESPPPPHYASPCDHGNHKQLIYVGS